LHSIQTTDIIPVELNCLLYKTEIILSNAYALSGNDIKTQYYVTSYEKRKAAINKYLWNKEAGYFLTTA